MTKTIVMNEKIDVLLIGNNPLELSKISDHLMQIPDKITRVEIAFDLKSGLSRLSSFKPNFIILDDNLGTQELSLALTSLSHLKRTKNIPITLLKNSNYKEAFGDAMNYVLKTDVSWRRLYMAFKNSLVSFRAQQYLKSFYRNRKRKLSSYWVSA